MLIYGKQPVNYLLDNHPNKINTLYISKDLDKKEFSRLNRFDFELKRIPSHAADKMSKSSNHQGFLAEIDEIVTKDLSYIKKCNFVVILASITDVGNIGAIIRTAYALGVDGVVVSGIKNLQLEPIFRSSSGALMDLPLIVHNNLYDVITACEESQLSLYGADMDGVDIRGIKCDDKKALILGNESSGIPGRALKRLKAKVKVGMENAFDSLNVSAAGAILIDRMR